MTYGGWHIERLKFTGTPTKEASLEFATGLSLVYGASNTGKSFALKALDFMLGGGTPIPAIEERHPYSTLWLEIAFTPEHRALLERAVVGGSFRLRENNDPPRTLAPKHSVKSPNNISTFLLAQMDAEGRKVAKDSSGTLENLSFRDIASLVLTNELAIQSENSPVESSDKAANTQERNVLKFMLTGEDDSAIVPVVRPKDFRLGRAAKASVLQDMIDQLNADLSADYPDVDGLADQSDRINQTLGQIESQLAAARSSIRALLDEKRRLSSEISAAERRSTELALGLNSFAQLQDVYASDIARLESLEEAGFLLGVDVDRRTNCPVCGAPPDAQVHTHGLTDIERVRVAAEVEIQKIRQQRAELIKTIEDTGAEQGRIVDSIVVLRQSLSDVELKLQEATPGAEEHQLALGDVVAIRDRVRRGLDLLAQRDRLNNQIAAIEASKSPKPDPTIQRGLSTETAKKFADVVSGVLSAWGFPGQRQVVFDLSTYDLIIDGKERRNNGKGVRAITHAAFKVALMLFCRDRNLPHPGFLVLDTPLLTYRDPMKKPGDRLEADELALQKTDLKKRFFSHLGQLGANAQIIVFENVDPPEGVEDYCQVEAFTNDPEQGRQGLL